jgi:Minor capsid protein
MISFKTRTNLNTSKLKSKQTAAKKAAQMQLDQDVLKDSNFFIPKQEGYLEASSLTHSRIGEGHIEWNTPYARRLYYNPQYNFSKDVNPNAQGLWFEAAKALHKPDWFETVRRQYEQYFNGK